MKKIFDNGWQERLEEEFQKDYYKKLRQFLKEEYRNHTIYPDMYDIFNALHYTSYEDAKVVIIGQDPYHGPGQAHGLSFSVKPGVRIPPSLVNIYKELHSDIGCSIPKHGHLTKWAKQGVMLLNASLTVRAASPASHSKIGWQHFTDRVIALLNEREDTIVFILWGNYAISKSKLITNPNHRIIRSVHPSPLSASRGFFGSKPFSQTNAILEEVGKEPIDWQIEEL